MHKNTSDIFCLKKSELDGNQIFSIGGSPSFRINRRRQGNSSVFPFGCMGNAEEVIELPTSPKPSDTDVSTDCSDVKEDTDSVHETDDSSKEPVAEESAINESQTKPKRATSPYKGLSARNPLTGEGIELPNPNKGKKGYSRRAGLTKWTW